MNEPLESEYDDTPQGWAQRWEMEFEAARKELKPWHEKGEKVVKRYLDKGASGRNQRNKERRLNLFTSNTQMLQAMLYGQTPKVDVTRKWADSGDSVARVAGEMLERILNADIARDSDTFAVALQQALEDRLLPGMGNVRVRYVAEFETVPGQPAQLHPLTGQELAPEVPPTEKKSYECVEVDYVYWKDQLWSPSRTFHDVRWWAFRAEMSRAELVKKFGEETGNQLPLNAKRTLKSKESDAQKMDPWGRADVWEIWDKESRCTWFFVEGFGRVLAPEGVAASENGSVEDPMGLEGFWPFPFPLAANTTTSGFVPQSDFVVAQDLYDEVDDYTTRIWAIEKALKVVGLYDKNAGDSVGRMLDEGRDNELIPVENWAMFAEKGGIKGRIDWLPIDQIVATLDKLRELRSESVQLLYQVTGFSDIMRGQQQANGTPGEAQAKAKFASIRVQRMQDEFARFASDVQKLKAEIIALQFEPETIIQESNILNTADAQMAQAAVELIKSKFAQYRIEVKPEAVSLTDFAAMQSERQNFVQGLSMFLTSAAPAAQFMPGSTTYLMQLLQWYLAGFRGSSSIQGVLDQAIASAEKQQAMAAQQPPQPNPKMMELQAKTQQEAQKAQIKSQSDAQKTQMDLQADLTRINAEVQADDARQRSQAQWNVQEERARHAIKVGAPASLVVPMSPNLGGGGV